MSFFVNWQDDHTGGAKLIILTFYRIKPPLLSSIQAKNILKIFLFFGGLNKLMYH